MRRAAIVVVVIGILGVLFGFPRATYGYSVLAHEAMVDAAWDTQIVPTLKLRFPRATAAQIREARAYAYGGSLIQDLGYYPFGSHLFTNLVHYIRAGAFVDTLVSDARDVNEYAFALGALAHYASDNSGHPIAVNRVVPLMYPKLAAEYGPTVLYAESPARHVMVEFSFDVTEVGRGTFKSDAFQALIGFEVATPLLERAFRSVYGLELQKLFGDADLAIGTFRHAASETIPQITREAWRSKRKEILAANPTVSERDVVFSMTQAQYREQFGTTYRKPGFLARFVVAIFKIVPKFGPFKPLAFQPLTPETEQMFVDSFSRAHTQYAGWLADARNGRLNLRDTDLDTGAVPRAGVNPLADETFDQLVSRLADGNTGLVPPPLRTAIQTHYASPQTTSGARVSFRHARKIRSQLAAIGVR